MVDAAEYWVGDDVRLGGEAVTVRLEGDRQALVGLGKSGPEAGVRPRPVVVALPLVEQASKVLFAEGDEVVEALATQGADEAFAEGVGPGRLHRSAQDPQAQSRDALIEMGGVDSVAVMDEEAVGVVAGEGLAQLLQSPLGLVTPGLTGPPTWRRAACRWVPRRQLKDIHSATHPGRLLPSLESDTELGEEGR